MVTFGVTIPQRGALMGLGELPELLELAPLAEATGRFDSVWVGDSLTAKPRPEAVALLGVLAGMTDHVRLGVGCMASFPVRDPAVFAYQWATLDRASGGRMLLAACTGIVSADRASDREGGHWGGVKDLDRPARMVENMAICRALWTGEEVTYDGRFHQYRDLQILPAPQQDPCPIWIAANPVPGRFWERSLRRVARRADGYMTTSMVPGLLAQSVTDLAPLLAEEGKSADTFPVMAYHNLNIGPDREACLEESQRFLDAYYGPVFTPEMTRTWTAAGTPDECVDQLNALIEAGATTITLRFTSWDQRGQLARAVEEVLPRLS